MEKNNIKLSSFSHFISVIIANTLFSLTIDIVFNILDESIHRT